MIQPFLSTSTEKRLNCHCERNEVERGNLFTYATYALLALRDCRVAPLHSAPRNDKSDKRGWQLALIGLLMALAGIANAQATWPVQTLIPEVLAIRTPSTNIAFDLSSANYPPASFPATYEATAPEGGVMPVQIYSNAEGFWSIELQISDVVDESGLLLIPASQLLYRVNGGVWLRADGTPQTIHTGSGATNGWQEIKLEFALELTGTERAGDYNISAVISGQRQAF